MSSLWPFSSHFEAKFTKGHYIRFGKHFLWLLCHCLLTIIIPFNNLTMQVIDGEENHGRTSEAPWTNSRCRITTGLWIKIVEPIKGFTIMRTHFAPSVKVVNPSSGRLQTWTVLPGPNTKRRQPSKFKKKIGKKCWMALLTIFYKRIEHWNDKTFRHRWTTISAEHKGFNDFKRDSRKIRNRLTLDWPWIFERTGSAYSSPWTSLFPSHSAFSLSTQPRK